MLPTNQVWKQVGPVLLKQDQSEAKANVSKRLEFIGGEMCVLLRWDEAGGELMRLCEQQARRDSARGTGRQARVQEDGGTLFALLGERGSELICARTVGASSNAGAAEATSGGAGRRGGTKGRDWTGDSSEWSVGNCMVCLCSSSGTGAW